MKINTESDRNTKNQEYTKRPHANEMVVHVICAALISNKNYQLF